MSAALDLRDRPRVFMTGKKESLQDIERRRQAMEALMSAEFFVPIYRLSAEGKDRHALRILFDRLGDLILVHEFGKVDAFLSQIDLSRLDSTTTLGFLSSTFAAKDHLSQWAPLRAKVEARFHEVGMASDKIERLLGDLR